LIARSTQINNAAWRKIAFSSTDMRPLKNTLFVIASEAKQSHNQLIIKEIATAHTRLAMTGNEFFKGLDISISFHQ